MRLMSLSRPSPEGGWEGAYPSSGLLRSQDTQDKILSLQVTVGRARHRHFCFHSPPPPRPRPIPPSTPHTHTHTHAHAAGKQGLSEGLSAALSAPPGIGQPNGQTGSPGPDHAGLSCLGFQFGRLLLEAWEAGIRPLLVCPGSRLGCTLRSSWLTHGS